MTYHNNRRDSLIDNRELVGDLPPEIASHIVDFAINITPELTKGQFSEDKICCVKALINQTSEMISNFNPATAVVTTRVNGHLPHVQTFEKMPSSRRVITH